MSRLASFIGFLSLATMAFGDVAAPSQVSFDHEGKKYQLDATGTATRKKFMVKVYNVTSYLEPGTVTKKVDAFQEILKDGKAKQLTLNWVHEASVKKVQEGYIETFKKVFSDADFNKQKKEIDTYIAFFNQDVKEGDVQEIRWLPGGYIEVLINGKSAGSITNVDFAKNLWSVWFGENSIVKRDDLISLIN